ncbi:hypothetical protein [Acaryochloris sp. IP29b_bin.137]|uniref:hypothetical protein n=1 Tax=Acaryochloris sp. IP29b_bin.137 TaxID=2969217 RepID=UPI002630853F|nr:hypothetical protein [Acaryochloris sp. IP29b_bin.137]
MANHLFSDYQFTEDDFSLSEYQLLRRYSDLKPKSQWREEELSAAISNVRPRIFGEGDSWFDFSFLGSDVLDKLMNPFNYAVRRTSQSGDTLAKMCTPENIRNTVTLCRDHEAIAFLFSGGGNDLFDGDPERDSQFFLLMNQKADGVPPIQEENLQAFLVYIKGLIIQMVDGIKTLGIPTIMAGYGYTIPSGRGALRFPRIGPWLKPALEARGYTDLGQQRAIVNDFVDAFNETLSSIETERENSFIHIDLRQVIVDQDWRDELHLDNPGFEKVAAKFDQAIQSI